MSTIRLLTTNAKQSRVRFDTPVGALPLPGTASDDPVVVILVVITIFVLVWGMRWVSWAFDSAVESLRPTTTVIVGVLAIVCSIVLLIITAVLSAQ